MNKIIGIIGTGNMGEAILKGIAKNHIVYAYDKDRKRARTVRRKYKVVLEDLNLLVSHSDIIILAVKPQNFEEVLNHLKGKIDKSKIVVSIAAGITTRYIEKLLGRNVRIVRTMPNLPALVGHGITAICPGKIAKKADLLLVSNIFETIGKTVVTEERFLDSITAMSGSGPAYVFLFIEMLFKASKKLGLNEKLARTLILETLKGSVVLLEKGKDSPNTLRTKVTSKGGTTQAAMDVFFKKKVDKIFVAALIAAKKRAKQLAK